MIRADEVYKIGMLTKPHGVRGEIAFSFTDDIFDRVECDYLICKMDGILVPFFLEDYRFKNNSVALVKFEDVDTAEQARRFTNVEVYFPSHLAQDVPQDELTWNYFVGFEVDEVHEGHLGTVTAVDDSTVNTLFVIDHGGKELLVPAHEEFICQIDHEARHITLQLPHGLLDLTQVERVD